MSIEQENIVREFLGPHWSRMPYDWVQELGPEGLEPMLPIPDAVWAAYDATRGDPIEHEMSTFTAVRRAVKRDIVRCSTGGLN